MNQSIGDVVQSLGNVHVGDGASANIGVVNNHYGHRTNSLQALSFQEMNDRLDQITDASPGTCAWIVEDPEYCRWQSSHGELIWIKGRPGTGKSTLMKYAWKHMLQATTSKTRITASFFCFGAGTDLQKTPSGIFRGLLYQILRQVPDLSVEFEEGFQARCEVQGDHGTKWNWTRSELRDLLKRYITKASLTTEMQVFIDALDECGEDNAQDLLEFCQSLATASKSRNGALRICVSSRHYPVIRADIPFVVLVDEKNTTDIETYVTEKLASIRKYGQEYEDLRSAIISRSGGVFQWTVLVVSRVVSSCRRKQSFESILEDIKETPQQLFGLYEQIIRSYLAGNDCRDRDKDRFRRLFQWMSLAKRPLTLREVRCAVEIDPSHQHGTCTVMTHSVHTGKQNDLDGEDIQHLSCGLVCLEEAERHSSPKDGRSSGREDHPLVSFKVRKKVKTWEKTVVFIHQSIYDYFHCGGIGLLRNCDSQLAICAAELELFKTCHKIVHLANQDPSIPMERSILEYAVWHLFDHACSVEAHANLQNELIRIFNWPAENCVEMLCRVSVRLKNFGTQAPIHPFSYDKSLIHAAAAFGIPTLLRYVLQHSPDLNINITDFKGRTPLHLAAKEGHINVVDALIDIKWTSGRRRRLAGWVPGSRVLKIDVRDHEGKTPLWHGAANGHVAVVERLIQTGKVDLDCKGGLRQCALTAALGNGHESMARLLITKGASIEGNDHHLCSTIDYTANRGGFHRVLSLIPQKANQPPPPAISEVHPDFMNKKVLFCFSPEFDSFLNDIKDKRKGWDRRAAA